MLRRNLLIYGARRPRRRRSSASSSSTCIIDAIGVQVTMRRQLLPALRMLVVLTVLLGLALPAGRDRRRPGRLRRQGRRLPRRRTPTASVVGSSLIGQALRRDAAVLPPPAVGGRRRLRRHRRARRVEPRPDATRSCSTAVAERVDRLPGARTASPPTPQVPVDAVTASGSGLDPHISVANARLQAPRVAEARGPRRRRGRSTSSTTTPTAARSGFLGEPGVNVLAAQPRPRRGRRERSRRWPTSTA